MCSKEPLLAKLTVVADDGQGRRSARDEFNSIWEIFVDIFEFLGQITVLWLLLGSLTIVIASSSVCLVYAELGIIMEGLYALVEIAP